LAGSILLHYILMAVGSNNESLPKLSFDPYRRIRIWKIFNQLRIFADGFGGPADGHVVELEPMLDEYYGIMGWDAQWVPTSQRLRELQLINGDDSS